MPKFIPLSVPNLNGNELKYVSQAVESGWVSTAGSFVNDFEQRIAGYVGSKGAVSCQNGTSGLHIALLLCGVAAGDEVIVPTLTFIAAVNPVKYAGAEPVFMDCDDSLCIDPDKLMDFCEKECSFTGGRLVNKKTGRHIKALVVVHVFGNMADMRRILDIAGRFNLKVVEDATEAIGTHYTESRHKGKYAGTMGDVGVYSFNGNKIMTTGGGGMIVSDNEAFLKEAKHLTTQAKTDEINYFHDKVGYNYRMTNLQAALGMAQLEQLEAFIETKNRNYDLYKDAISQKEGLRLLPFREDIRANKWFYALFLEENYAMDVQSLIRHLAEHAVQARPIWGLIHEQGPYVQCRAYEIQRASYYFNHVLNIPCSTDLNEEDVARVASCL